MPVLAGDLDCLSGKAPRRLTTKDDPEHQRGEQFARLHPCELLFCAALGRAEATLPSRAPDDPAGLFVIWDESRFPGWAGKTLLLLEDPAATSLLERALAMTSAPHPRLGLLVDLGLARIGDGDADHAIALLVEGTQLAIERGIEGFARWRLQEGRNRLSPAQRRAFDSRLHAVA